MLSWVSSRRGIVRGHALADGVACAGLIFE